MKKIFVMIFVGTALGFLTFSPSANASSPEGQMNVEVHDPDVAAVRLEVFDARTSEQLFDSGIVSGSSLAVPANAYDEMSKVDRVVVELRSWDRAGDLVSSQITNLRSRNVGEISSINFEEIPSGTNIVSSAITLQGDVAVTGDLSAAALRQPGGGPFFGACSAGSSIRSIDPNGTVTCETDDVGGGGGDNLGDHTATQILNMGIHWVEFFPNFGIRTTQGAEVVTGTMGRTFQFKAGAAPNPADAAIANFRDQNNVLAIAVPQSGSFRYIKGQKLCRVWVAGGWSDTLIASGGWSAANCSNYATATGASSWAIGCLFDNGISQGSGGANLPSPNCGW